MAKRGAQHGAAGGSRAQTVYNGTPGAGESAVRAAAGSSARRWGSRALRRARARAVRQGNAQSWGRQAWSQTKESRQTARAPVRGAQLNSVPIMGVGNGVIYTGSNAWHAKGVAHQWFTIQK